MKPCFCLQTTKIGATAGAARLTGCECGQKASGFFFYFLDREPFPTIRPPSCPPSTPRPFAPTRTHARLLSRVLSFTSGARVCFLFFCVFIFFLDGTRRRLRLFRTSFPSFFFFFCSTGSRSDRKLLPREQLPAAPPPPHPPSLPSLLPPIKHGQGHATARGATARATGISLKSR